MTEPASKKRRTIDDKPRKDWDPHAPDAFIGHSGGIYGYSLNIPTVLYSIIDTPPFQRLDGIRQLGLVNHVYRQATHTRFVHSIGTAHVAFLFMEKLKRICPNVTGNDMLCVITAALCHDLGHGPFSHTFELIVNELGNNDFRHEDMSIKIFDYILENEPNVRKSLDVYLNEKDYIFIKELIDPPPFPAYHVDWKLKGRGPDKAFLYEIVSNTSSGFDIDKIDYILRDSHHSVAVNIDLNWLSRILLGLNILEENGITRLAFDDKLSSCCQNLFNSRQQLYSDVYFHKKLFPLEQELKMALKYAAKHLEFRGKNGESLNLYEAVDDIETYIKLKDETLLSMIEHSFNTSEDMKKARKCLDNIKRRKVAKTIIRFDIKPIDRSGPKYSRKDIDNIINEFYQKYPNFKEKIKHAVRAYHHGKGVGNNPTKNLIYSERGTSPQKERITNEIELISYYSVFFYGDYGIEPNLVEDAGKKLFNFWKNFDISGSFIFKLKNCNNNINNNNNCEEL